jgi:uncharacterized membrane protein YdjX (TVP38/TMEM64 family)
MHNGLQETWRRISGFFVHLDAKMYRAIVATLVLFGLVVAVFLAGKSPWGKAVMDGLNGWMGQYQHSPLAILIVTLVFCIAALIGAPQFILIAGCVHVFGAWWGFLYSWIATVISAAMTFFMGRLFGTGVLNKFGGNHTDRLAAYIGKNTFSASFIIRNLPSAPFIVVNMAFGAARAPFVAFILGCTLGVLPKTALVAMFGRSYEAAMKGNWKMMLLMAVLAFAWLGLMLGARKLYEAGKARGGQG